MGSWFYSAFRTPHSAFISSLDPLPRQADEHVFQRDIADDDVLAHVAAGLKRRFPGLEEPPRDVVSSETLDRVLSDSVLEHLWFVQRDDPSRPHDGHAVAERVRLLDIVRR